jgi:hypothetical protein
MDNYIQDLQIFIPGENNYDTNLISIIPNT